MSQATSKRIQDVSQSVATVGEFFFTSKWFKKLGDPDICDFMVGNPQEMALPNFMTALQAKIEPRHALWYGYKDNEVHSQQIVAESLNERYALGFEAADICMTNGAFAGLSVALLTVTDPGDEVIYIRPPWFFYDALIEAAGAKAVAVDCHPQTFDLDVDAIAQAITPRTRAIIINSPNNPTGKIYPVETLQRLADVLMKASVTHGRPIYLLSDEAYSRIIYDNHPFVTPTSIYPHSFLIYTYGKTLLTPGQRLGYIAMPPTMPHREELREALYVAQLATGYAFPNALMQYALRDLDKMSIDIQHLEAKRNRLGQALLAMGYELQLPEGTFYLLVKSPLADELAFIDILVEMDIFVLAGRTFERPGYFRISLTATDAMIEKAIPGFEKALAGTR